MVHLSKKEKKELHFVAVSSRSQTGNLDGTIGQTALFCGFGPL